MECRGLPTAFLMKSTVKRSCWVNEVNPLEPKYIKVYFSALLTDTDTLAGKFEWNRRWCYD
eukprot:scaffold21_cov107-Cylindrotheca_fusiformis.AAC.12